MIEIDKTYHQAFYNRGYVKDKIKDYYGAISDYNKAIFLKKDYENAYINRAYAKSDIGDLLGAISDFTTLININSKNYERWLD